MKQLLSKSLIPAILAALICTVVIMQYNTFTTSPLAIDSPVSYTVKPGSNLKSISEELKAQNISPLPPIYLQVYGRINDVSHKIQAGEYELLPTDTLPDVLNKLVKGKVIMNSITIVEGMTAQQIIDEVTTHTKITKTLDPPTVAEAMKNIDPEIKQGEGWFLPETYYFPTGTTDVQFLRRAHEQLQKVLAQAWEYRAKDLPYKTPYEALIMASIIEKETALAEERPEISGVFVRRLKMGMRLQTDPTVIYGISQSFDGNLRKKDLTTDTPYNTYTRSGLPPTPICLPSRESITAALHPKEGDSLYFVATGEGGRHQFSSNLRDHNNAVRRYQLNKK
ncbi:MAG TPA: endolytic transglycosylase MltG [Methylophaga aminisulfidivorans]|uniref:Endolytic murein transglycosylase n=2 Tax=root TaxID=1 RepID=A0A7C2ANR7_9GAMM|nr:endolytic transglycosylase MltG [Methylophaga aminisulfidivorans]